MAAFGNWKEKSHLIRRITQDMAAIILNRGTMQFKGSSSSRRDGGEGNIIQIPQLPDRKELLAEYDVEILMLDGYVCRCMLTFQFQLVSNTVPNNRFQP